MYTYIKVCAGERESQEQEGVGVVVNDVDEGSERKQEASPLHHVHLWWCPGHSNFAENELVDSDVNIARQDFPEAPHTSFAIARSKATATVYNEWREIGNLGHDFIPNATLRTIAAGAKGPILPLTGSDNLLTACLTRAILNYAPIGEYRRRFFPHENQQCPSCHVLQTRRHILSKCPCYHRSTPNFLEFLINPSKLAPLLIQFLKL